MCKDHFAGIGRTLVVMAAFVTLASCEADLLPDGGTPQDAAVDVVVSDAAPKPLSDPQVVGVLDAADSVAIGGGQLAVQRSGNPSVQTFATTAIRQGTQSIQVRAQLVASVGLVSQSSALSQQITNQGEQELGVLASLNGSAFDVMYVEAQVSGLRQLLDVIDGALLPSVQNPELKAFVVMYRAGVMASLTAAQTLLTQLTGIVSPTATTNVVPRTAVPPPVALPPR